MGSPKIVRSSIIRSNSHVHFSPIQSLATDQSGDNIPIKIINKENSSREKLVLNEGTLPGGYREMPEYKLNQDIIRN